MNSNYFQEGRTTPINRMKNTIERIHIPIIKTNKMQARALKSVILSVFSLFVFTATATADQFEVATINKVWTTSNAIVNGVEGLRIHLDFSTEYMKGKTGQVAVYFYHENGQPVKDINFEYDTRGGNVCVWDKFTASYDVSDFENYELFIPNEEFHLSGSHNLKFHISVIYGDKIIGSSRDYYAVSLNLLAQVIQPKQLTDYASNVSDVTSPQNTGSSRVQVTLKNCADYNKYTVAIFNTDWRFNGYVTPKGGNGQVSFTVPPGDYFVEVAWKGSGSTREATPYDRRYMSIKADNQYNVALERLD